MKTNKPAALSDEHLTYPHRNYGMDHEHYDWSLLTDRKAISWPGAKPLALWVNVPLQLYPLNQKGIPFKVPGGMTMPYPDLRHYTLRDYGNRVGIFRLLKAFDQYNITPTFAVNGILAQQNPYLMNVVKERGNEVIGHGLHMDALHYGGQPIAQEQQLIQQSLDLLREYTNQAVRGWLSPVRSESEHTPQLLKEHGIEYFCDWVNDDMPYPFKTPSGELTAMPLSNELDDVFILMNNQHSEQSYVDQICDACDFLIDEAMTQGGRILSLNIHPWMLGQPHRIKRLEQVLEYVTSKNVWNASSGDILAHFINQQ